MIAVNVNELEKSYGIEQVLRGFSMSINMGEKVGLIGPNGSGKTTVFRIIAGREERYRGTVSLKKGINVGFLEQVADFDPKNTLYEELLSVFSLQIARKNRLSELEDKISRAGEQKNENELDSLLREYSEFRSNFEKDGGYEYESKILKVAIGMGFTEEELEGKKTSVLSGGEKTRLGLVKLLLSEPGLLLLDEPTNHLDITSVEWLENYLKDYTGAVIVISHDRYFLDRVIDRIVELKQGKAEKYYGNYSYYLKKRKERYERRLQAYENQQKKIKEKKEAIERLRRWGSQGDNEKFFRRAKSMEKELEKMERIPKPILGGDEMNLEFAFCNQGGRDVLRIKDCCKSFQGEQVLSDLDFSLYRGEKVGIIGENGTGKTTLLKIIQGQIMPDRGQVDIGANVYPGFYDQEFSGFDGEDDLVTALRRETAVTEGRARNLLASFLFRGDDVFKKVKELSGGEKSRLRLLQLMRGNYNFLILDEPTNHLDLSSREVLEDALKEYPGTVLVVSHDRYFLNKIIEYTYELESGSLTKYYGNYDYYRQKKNDRQMQQTDCGQKKDSFEKQDNFYYQQKKKQRRERKRKRRLNNLENRIEKLEQRKKKIEKEMAAPDNLEDYSKLKELDEEYIQIGKELENLYEKWESYMEEIN
ncbi:MAG: ribosomal protection-like ABC-F family protein [Halanaerobiaceae bacterium]